MSPTRSIVFAIETLTFAGAWDISLEALTVLLLTEAIFALAAFKMLVLTDFVLKGKYVPLKDISNCILPLLFEILVVIADIASCLGRLFALACWSTGRLIS